MQMPHPPFTHHGNPPIPNPQPLPPTGALLGLLILAFAAAWDGVSTEVGIIVAIALPLVSLWANGLGAAFTLLADRFKLDPAITSVPLMTTIVDCTGLVVYFYLAKWILGLEMIQKLNL
jgi:Mg/Co/Ni transporter MgtE